MSVTARKRSYGDFEWISIADTAEGKDAVRKREKKRERDSDAGYQEMLSERQKGSAEIRMEEAKAELAQQEAPPEGWARREGKSWYSIMRTRWRNMNRQAKLHGHDGMPWDAYKALWDAAGLVTPPWGGQDTEAYKLQDKYFSKRFRCLLTRWDEERGFKAGNCGVILVEGYYRSRQNKHLRPTQYEVLSAWEKDGRITDRDGNTADNVSTT